MTWARRSVASVICRLTADPVFVYEAQRNPSRHVNNETFQMLKPLLVMQRLLTGVEGWERSHRGGYPGFCCVLEEEIQFRDVFEKVESVGLMLRPVEN